MSMSYTRVHKSQAEGKFNQYILEKVIIEIPDSVLLLCLWQRVLNKLCGSYLALGGGVRSGVI